MQQNVKAECIGREQEEIINSNKWMSITTTQITLVLSETHKRTCLEVINTKLLVKEFPLPTLILQKFSSTILLVEDNMRMAESDYKNLNMVSIDCQKYI